MRLSVTFAVAAWLFLAPIATQQVPTRALRAPDAEFADPFSGIVAVLEIRDGRVIVADNRDRTLQLIDFSTKTATPIGRMGAGPGEWIRPLRLLRMPGDTTFIYDMGNSRYLVVAPDGRAVRTYSPFADAAVRGRGVAPPPNTDDGRGRSGGAGRGGEAGLTMNTLASGGLTTATVLTATQTDRTGRVYYTGFPVTAAARGVGAVDTFPLVRQMLTSSIADTIVWLRNPPNASEISGTTGAFRINAMRPFESSDAWVAFPNGRVVIVRGADYHLDAIQPNGSVTRGAPVPYTPIRVTEADKRQWRDARTGATVTTPSGQVVPLANLPDPDSWPDRKSPFAANSVFGAPNGEVWVFRQRAADDRIPSADVFDARGALVARVTLPADTRPIALGLRGVYAIRTDADGLQYLQRYAMTWERCTTDLAENCRTR